MSFPTVLASVLSNCFHFLGDILCFSAFAHATSALLIFPSPPPVHGKRLFFMIPLSIILFSMHLYKADCSLLRAPKLACILPSVQCLTHWGTCVFILSSTTLLLPFFFLPEHELLEGREHGLLTLESPSPGTEPSPPDTQTCVQ